MALEQGGVFIVPSLLVFTVSPEASLHLLSLYDKQDVILRTIFKTNIDLPGNVNTGLCGLTFSHLKLNLLEAQ